MDKTTYYTALCKTFNPNSRFPKLIRLYNKKKWLYLPNEWVYFLDTKQEIKSINLLQEKPRWKLLKQPREEQVWILEIARKRIAKHNYPSGIINMKTGRGKSLVLSEIANYLPWTILILCHNEMACRWMVSHFKEFYNLENIWTAYGGKNIIKEITVATHKTFAMHPEYFKGFNIIMYDEMHKNISASMIAALCEMRECKAFYGFSATPFRDDLDKNDLERIFGREIVVQNFTTPEQRYNILPKLYIEEYKTPRYDFIDYNELRNCLVNDEERINKQMETLMKYVNQFDRRCSLVFTDRVIESELYEKKLRKNPSISVVLINWLVDTAEGIARLTEALKNWNKPLVIVWTIQKLWTGIDIPEIDAIFFFSPTKFNWTVIQGVGRWLRLSNRKSDVILVDWHDNDKSMLHRQHLQRVKICKREYWAISNS